MIPLMLMLIVIMMLVDATFNTYVKSFSRSSSVTTSLNCIIKEYDNACNKRSEMNLLKRFNWHLAFYNLN